MNRLVLLSVVACFSLSAPAQRSGREVLATSAAALNAAKTLSATCTEQHITATTVHVESTTFTIQLAKPNKARIDLPDQVIVADGATITNYDKVAKTFMRNPQTAADFKSLFASDELGLFAAFFDPDVYNKVQTGKVEKKSRRGGSYDAIEVYIDLGGMAAGSIYVDPADKMAKIGEFTPAESETKETVVIAAKEFGIDAAQEAGAYAFKAPAGAREITLADLIKANTFEAPSTFNEKALETFHLYQCDPRGNFPNGGQDFCAPTAAANALAYLGLHGYPRIFDGDDLKALDLIRTLALPDYMGTDPSAGTGPNQVIKGVTKYIGDKGYAIQTIGFEGWRYLDRKTRGYRVSDTLDLDWVRRGIAIPNSLVLFNIGWYNVGANGQYSRFQGHWVTAVGYGSNGGGGAVDPYLFLAHNPSTLLRNPPDDPKGWLPIDTLKFTPMTSGTLTGTESGLPRPVNGMLLASGKGIRSGAQCGILDGVVVIVLKPAKG